MSSQVPLWAKKFISAERKSEIEKKISEIEMHTAGEVVVMIAERSSPISHVPYSLFVSLLLVFTLIDLPHLQAAYSGEIWWPIIFWPVLALMLTRLLSSSAWIQRLFLPKEERARLVELRAENEFYRYGLQKTGNSTGVLVFVSLLEHQAVVLGDRNSALKLPPETWEKVLADLMSEAKKGKLSEGLLAALGDIGPILSQHFPSTPRNPNELPNHLIFVEA